MKKLLRSKSWFVLLGLICPMLALLVVGCKHVEGHYASLNPPAAEKAAPVALGGT